MGRMEMMGVLRGEALLEVADRACAARVFGCALLLIPPEDMDYRWELQFIRTCMILGVVFTICVCGCLVSLLYRCL